MKNINKVFNFFLVNLTLFIIAGCANTMKKNAGTAYFYKESSGDIASVQLQQGHQTQHQEYFTENDIKIDRKHLFTMVLFISDKRALVRKGRDPKLYVFHLDTENLQPLHDTAYWTGVERTSYAPMPVTFVPPSSTTKSIDLTVYFPLSKTPTIFQDITFARHRREISGVLERGPEFLVLHKFQPETDQRQSWTFDFAGKVIADSPYGIYSLITKTDLKTSTKKEFALALAPITGKNFQGQMPFVPLDEKGQVLPLPNGAHSTIAIPSDTGHTLGHIVLFPSKSASGEYEGVLHLGPHATIPQDLSGKPRIIDFKSYTHPNMPFPNYSIFTQSTNGDWSIAPESSYEYRKFFNASEVKGDNAELTKVLKNKIKFYEEQNAIKSAEEQKKFYATAAGQKLLRDQAARANAANNHLQSMKENPTYYCGRFTEAVKLGKEYVATFIQNCPATVDQLGQARVLGVNQSLVEQADRNRLAQINYNRQAQENQLQNTINSQRGTYEPQINVGTGTGGSAAQGTYGYQQQRAQWEKNLERTLNRRQNP